MMRRPFHPILFAIYPVLALYSHNTAIIPPGDVPVPLLSVLLGTLVLWGILTLILRSPGRAAAGASVAVVGFFSNGHLWDVMQQFANSRLWFRDRDDLLWTWLPIWLVAVALGCWKWKRSEGVTKGMNVGGIVLAGVPILSIAASWITAWLGTDIKEVRSTTAKLNTSVRPNICYVILDGYGRSDALKNVIGVSNDWFIKGLRDRGFYVADNARSNYCETELSLASSLNLDYLPTLIPNMKPDWDDRKVLDNLIDKSEVSKYLRSIGYKYEAITTGFPSVHPSSADLWIRGPQGISLFAGVLMADTPVPQKVDMGFMSQFDSRRALLKTAFPTWAQTATAPEPDPLFIFMHVLAPHPPFVLGPNGESVRPRTNFGLVDGDHFYMNGGTPAEYAKGYADQATYISKLALSAIDDILKNSKIPPVIIIQGDHGSKMKLNQELLEKTDVNECFPNLNAFYVPPKVKEKLYDGITPVNSFRLLFNGLFDDNFAKLPDRSYYSGWSSPFKFIEVTNKIKPAASKE